MRDVSAELTVIAVAAALDDERNLRVEVLHHRSNVWKLRGEATVDGTLCASGELLASIVDREG